MENDFSNKNINNNKESSDQPDPLTESQMDDSALNETAPIKKLKVELTSEEKGKGDLPSSDEEEMEHHPTGDPESTAGWYSEEISSKAAKVIKGYWRVE